jgi:hypothetical protein
MGIRSTLRTMDRSAPRSTVVDITWRPCLAFYEQGVPLLRRFEDAGLLRRFRVAEHVVEAQLRDGTRMAVGVTGMSVVGGRELPIHQACSWIHEVAAAVRPSDISVTFFIQCLRALDLELTYPAACRRASAAWMPGPAELGIYDSAPLVDGLAPSGLRYQAEFGVIDAEEAPARLSRSLGNRIGGPGLDPLPDDDYPPLAVFVDSSWFPQGAPADADNLAQWVLPVLDQATAETQDLTNALHRLCVHGPGPAKEGGELSEHHSPSEVRARS